MNLGGHAHLQQRFQPREPPLKRCTTSLESQVASPMAIVCHGWSDSISWASGICHVGCSWPLAELASHDYNEWASFYNTIEEGSQIHSHGLFLVSQKGMEWRSRTKGVPLFGTKRFCLTAICNLQRSDQVEKAQKKGACRNMSCWIVILFRKQSFLSQLNSVLWPSSKSTECGWWDASCRVFASLVGSINTHLVCMCIDKHNLLQAQILCVKRFGECLVTASWVEPKGRQLQVGLWSTTKTLCFHRS